MHIGGMGDQAKLAEAVGRVFAKIKETATIRREELAAGIDPSKTTLDPRQIEEVLGAKGESAGGVYKITIGRTTKLHGQTVGNTMGVNTWAAFVGGDEKAVVDGDFAMYEDELQGVLQALRRAGIDV